MPTEQAARRSRFFIALRPDAAAATRLDGVAAALADRCRGKSLAAGDLHLTLAFIGERAEADAAHLNGLLAGLPGQAPGLSLDTIGRFGPALLWAGPAAAPDWLHALAQSVRERLAAAGVAFDTRPLHPHLTLVRNARDRAAAASLVGACHRAIEVAHWHLALGGSRAAPDDGERYRWYPLPGVEPR
jgi:2'-5' RNA ligase